MPQGGHQHPLEQASQGYKSDPIGRAIQVQAQDARLRNSVAAVA